MDKADFTNGEYVLSVDMGTQSVRAIIFDKGGRIKAKHKIEYEPYYSTRPGWAEKDPLLFWNGMCDALKEVKKESGDLWSSLRGIVVTAIRDTPICLDKDDNILRPAIIWLDQRMASGKPELPSVVGKLMDLVGMKETLTILYRKAKSNWIKENEPDIWQKTAKYMQVSSYINYLLTGKYVDSEASQIGYIPFDYKAKEWYSDTNLKYKLSGVERNRLPKIVPPGDILGYVLPKIAAETGLPEGLPVIAGGSDKGCETLGVGCLDESFASISLGTTATIQTTTNRYYEAIRFLPPYPAVIPGCYNPEVQIFRGYWLISWFKKEFSQKEVLEAEKKKMAPEELLNNLLDEVPPGCHGLVLHPMWSPGILTPKAKGAVVGFGDVHTRIHLYRAIIEGIAFSLLEGLHKIEKKSGKKIKAISVSGGGSQSDVICQITADIFNLPVKRIHTYEASGLGAAIIGMVGTGAYSSFNEAIEKMIHYEDIFQPRLDNVMIYNALYKDVFLRIYPRLKGIYDDIQRITGYPQI